MLLYQTSLTISEWKIVDSYCHAFVHQFPSTSTSLMPNISHCPQWAGITVMPQKIVFTHIQNSGNFKMIDMKLLLREKELLLREKEPSQSLCKRDIGHLVARGKHIISCKNTL